MNSDIILAVLAWCLVFNLSILILWALFLLVMPNWLYTIQSDLIAVTREQFNQAHFFLFGLYKLFIVVFMLVPYMSLRLIT